MDNDLDHQFAEEQFVEEQFAEETASHAALMLLPLFSGYEYPDLSIEQLHPSYSTTTPITELTGLSVRASNVIGCLDIFSLGQLLLTSDERLMSTRNCGVTTLKNIQKAVTTFLDLDAEVNGVRENPHGNDVAFPPPEVLNLPVKCRRALSELKVKSTEDFIRLEAPRVMEMKGVGQTTCDRILTARQQFIHRVQLSDIYEIGTREANALRQLQVSTLRDLLQLNLRHALRASECDETTLRSLTEKQAILKGCSSTNNRDWQRLRKEWADGVVTRENIHFLPFFSGNIESSLCADDLHASYQGDMSLAYVGIPGRGLSACERLGVATIGELLLTPYQAFDDLSNCGEMTIWRMQKDIEKLLLTSLLTVNIDTASCAAFIDSVFKPFLKDKRQKDILFARLGVFEAPATLQDVSKAIGITRERVRQIERKIFKASSSELAKRQLEPLRVLLRDMLHECHWIASLDDVGQKCAERWNWDAPASGNIVLRLLELFPEEFDTIDRKWCTVKDFPCWRCERCPQIFKKTLEESPRDSYPIEQLCKDAADAVNSVCAGCNHVEMLVPSKSLLSVVFHSSGETFSEWRLDDNAVLRKARCEVRHVSMQEVIAEVLRSNPTVMNYKDIHRAITENSTEKRNLPTPENVRSTINNVLTQNGSVLLWNRGGDFIHRDHVNPYLPIVSSIEKQVIEKLSSGDVHQMSLYNLFGEHKKSCLAAGLPSCYAVFSLLKLRAHPKLRFLRSPYVAWHSTSGGKRSVRELLEEYILDYEDGISSKALRDHAYGGLGMTEGHYSNTMQHMDSVIRTDKGHLHVDHFDSESSQFKRLVRQIRKMLERQEHVSARFIFEENKVRCIQMGIIGPRMLASVLEHFAADEVGNISFPIIRVATADSKPETTSLGREVENFLLESKGPRSREAIMLHFAEQRGYSRQRLQISIYCLTKEDVLKYGEALYVHRQTIGWNSEKQRLLMDLVTKYHDKQLAVNSVYVCCDAFLDESHDLLPSLEGDIEWSASLLLSLARRSPKVLVLGNAGKAFLLTGRNNNIHCFGDFIKQVLVDRFQGGANLTELSGCLRDMGIVRKRLTPRMIDGYYELVVTKHEISVTE